MKIRILGAGWYGCHLGTVLAEDGHEVEIYEKEGNIFSGASGSNPARLHLGFHYPRSRLTRVACQEHNAKFMEKYGALTRGVRTNIYAVADKESHVDYGNYCQTLGKEVQFVEIVRPEEYGLSNVEGAILTGERHIVIEEATTYFKYRLDSLGVKITFGARTDECVKNGVDLTIDCTFCANGSAGVDRYEPCITTLLSGPVGTAITIMDGPFPSIYPWNEGRGLCSLTSAKFTPFRRCSSYVEAEEVLNNISASAAKQRSVEMLEQIKHYWSGAEDYRIAGERLSIRAMPKSGADARLVDVVKIEPGFLRVRAGKIDAVIYAEQIIKGMLG